MTRVFAACALAALVGACDKKEPAPAPAPSASASARSAAVDAGPPRNVWSGAYDAKPGTLSVPEGAEWKGVKFRGDDAGEALGAGTLRLEIEPDGRVHGDGDGALGPFVVAGTQSGEVLTFSVLRKDPSDMGPTGTGRGTLTATALEGTIHAAKATGNVIREATFSLRR